MAATYPTSDESRERLKAAGWSVGHVRCGSGPALVWQASGTNGENLLVVYGVTLAEAYWRACEQARTLGNYNVGAYCLACLAKHPGASFGQRLLACRVAAGLTLRQLAARTGTTFQQLNGYEQDVVSPAWDTLAKQIRVLGPGLVTLGLVDDHG